jgi:hypothetical protein
LGIVPYAKTRHALFMKGRLYEIQSRHHVRLSLVRELLQIKSLQTDGNDYHFLAKRNPFFSETEIIVA